ncbi:hypothetical protein [uncultured Oscillibacter sp.]|uniref:hypothetical protein n=1 Tax=uncultured Oscillibacter sp. TaxID=876091 RepID=UPI00266F183E|nr:hypothetical protein [uncultured Oscillibacter sp.]
MDMLGEQKCRADKFRPAFSLSKKSAIWRTFFGISKCSKIGIGVRKMLERGKNERGVIEMVDTESLMLPGHLLRQVDAAVKFEKLYEIVEPLYSEEEAGHRQI